MYSNRVSKSMQLFEGHYFYNVKEHNEPLKVTLIFVVLARKKEALALQMWKSAWR